MKSPAFQFYSGDWLRAAELRMCSIAARGLWIDMIAFMHQAKPYGYLVFAGKPVSSAQLARMVGERPETVEVLLAEMQSAGVYSVDESGAIYCRRMVRDEAKREAWRQEKKHQRSDTPPDNGPDIATDTDTDKASVSAAPSAACPPDLHSSVLPSSKPKPKPRFALPEWIGSEAWDAYLDMRKRLRKPATDRAKELVVLALEKLRGEGHDPNAVLEQSIRNSWQDVYAIKASVGAKSVDAWWTSDEGIQRKGRDLGMSPRAGETMASYRDRIKQRMEQGRAIA